MSVHEGQQSNHIRDVNPELKYAGTGSFNDGLPSGATPLCDGMDVEIFFPANDTNVERPRLCIECSLTEFCLTRSIEMGETNEGIWGGAVPHERKALAKLPRSERAEAIGAFVTAIKKNPRIPSRSGVLPGRDPIRAQKNPTKQNNHHRNTTVGQSKEPTPAERLDVVPQNRMSLTLATTPQNQNHSSRKPSRFRHSPPAPVHKDKIAAIEGDELYYEIASRVLGLDKLYSPNSVDTETWIQILRGAERSLSFEDLAKVHGLPVSTVRLRVGVMRKALQRCSPDLRNQLLGIDVA